MRNIKRADKIIFIAIFISLSVSGCMNTPSSQVTPATPAPSVVATVTPMAPIINVTSYPASVDPDTNLGIDWTVSGGMPGNIGRTAIIWGFERGKANLSDYPEMSTVRTGKTPQQFNDTLNVTTTNVTVYFRAYAAVDGIDIYSDEYHTIIVPPGVSGMN